MAWILILTLIIVALQFLAYMGVFVGLTVIGYGITEIFKPSMGGFWAGNIGIIFIVMLIVAFIISANGRNI